MRTQQVTLNDLSDILNTMQDGIAAVAAHIYQDLIIKEVLTVAEASEGLRDVAKHMRSPSHKSPIIGEGIARKLEDYALVFMTAGQNES